MEMPSSSSVWGAAASWAPEGEEEAIKSAGWARRSKPDWLETGKLNHVPELLKITNSNQFKEDHVSNKKAIHLKAVLPVSKSVTAQRR